MVMEARASSHGLYCRCLRCRRGCRSLWIDTKTPPMLEVWAVPPPPRVAARSPPRPSARAGLLSRQGCRSLRVEIRTPPGVAARPPPPPSARDSLLSRRGCRSLQVDTNMPPVRGWVDVPPAPRAMPRAPCACLLCRRGWTASCGLLRVVVKPRRKFRRRHR